MIAGLYGEEYSQINNKIGYVKEILFSGDHYISKFSAKIFIGGEYHTIDFDFLFKIENVKIDISEHNMIIGNAVVYYVTKYGLTNVTGVIDEYYQFTMVAKTDQDLYKKYLISGLC